MVEKCPDAMLIEDKCPLDYVLLGHASIAVINFLFMTHSKRWGALPFDFSDIIQWLMACKVGQTFTVCER
jgi:hypothetical protein